MVKTLFAAVGAMALVLTGTAARADDSVDAGADAVPEAPSPVKLPLEPALHHVPLSTAREHEALTVSAVIDRPDLLRRAVLVYRHGRQIEEVLFARAATGAVRYVAVVPAEHVVRPDIAYAVELEKADGAREAVFATRDAMQPIEVVGDTTDVKEETLLARLHGRRFVTSADAEYAYFGSTTATVTNGGKVTHPSVNDHFYQVEGAFTYRMLRTVSEFGVRAGVYRGTSAVPNANDPNQFNVGLNYGAPWLRLRATDWLHLEGELLTSVTEVGFSLGGGGAVLVGDPYGADLAVGFESIQVFGTRGYSRFEAHALPWFVVAPMIEVTSMPHGSTVGVRLLLDLGFDLGKGFSMVLRGGYQARSFASGGPAVGGTFSYAF